MLHILKNDSHRVEDDNINWEHYVYQIRDIDRVVTTEVTTRLTNSFELIAVMEGKGRMTIEQESFPLNAQDVCFIHPSQVYNIQTKYGESIECILFKFTIFSDLEIQGASFELLSKDHAFPLKGKLSLGNFSKVLEMAGRLQRLKNSIKNDKRFQMRIMFEQLMLFIIQNRYSPVEKDTLTVIEETRLFIDHHFHQNLSIESLASMADLSPKYYSALFKKEYDISVSEYIMKLRVNHAKQLLAKGQKKIRDIAKEVGYSDEFYLSRKFKQTVGISSSTYRKKRKQKVAAYDFSTIGHLMALHILPYAAPIHPKWTSHYYQKIRNDIPVHLSAFQINKDWRENIQTLSNNPPDLIISKENISEDEKERLSGIAPVFYYSTSLNWRDQLLIIAEYLEEKREANEWLQNYQRQVVFTQNQIKKHVGQSSFLPLRFYQGRLYLDHSRTMKEVLYGDLQMTAPHTNSDSLNHVISLIDLQAINPDRILLNICQETKTLESWNSFQSESLWNDLKAVRMHQVYSITSDPWREYSPSAHERVLKEALKFLHGKSPTMNQDYVHVQSNINPVYF
ncbi:AraC family transcriptional regulator [Rossellomorea sp. BNER]|uniref:AraC family transcriptional regulator n=1 Tax=Rossellomorea sp. BNER TaxID=2962031 RepID=UPI003AF2D013|nr:AraC family transcriptional regulator [Rossellomorea sp. BNER]